MWFFKLSLLYIFKITPKYEIISEEMYLNGWRDAHELNSIPKVIISRQSSKNSTDRK